MFDHYCSMATIMNLVFSYSLSFHSKCIGWVHSGISLTLLGEIAFSELSSNPIVKKFLLPNSCDSQASMKRSSSNIQARHHQSRKIRLIESNIPLLPRGALSYGIHKIPFSFVLQPMIVDSVSYRELKETLPLYETFHGDLISIQYKLRVVINRGFFSRLLDCCLEIQVEIPTCSQEKYNDLQPGSSVHLTPSDLVVYSGDRMVDKGVNSIYDPSSQTTSSLWIQQIPPIFDVEVEIDSSTLNLNSSLNGKLLVHSCNCSISGISMYLRRIESLFLQKCNKSINDGTETPLKTVDSIIKKLQIACGNIRKRVEIPISMEYPNLLASPTASYREGSLHSTASGSQGSFGFQIAYEIRVVIYFENYWKAEKSIPVVLFRQ